MRHNLKQIAQNFRLPLRGFIEFALKNPNKFGIDEENGIVTTSTFWTELLVQEFRVTYLPRIGDTFFDTTKTSYPTGKTFRINSFLKYNGGLGRRSYTYCNYEEATHITGSGICGWLGKKEDIEVVGNVPDDLYEILLKEFKDRIGQKLIL